jgi:hypothetical protein
MTALGHTARHLCANIVIAGVYIRVDCLLAFMLYL